MKNAAPVFVLGIFISSFLVFGNCCNKQHGLTGSRWDSVNIGPDSISFIVMGDWGKYGGQWQKSVANAMNEYSKKFHTQFIITTGDNFYPMGVSNTSDAHWKLSFENIYNKEGHQIPWYPVLGNHDYQQNPNAEIEYSAISGRRKNAFEQSFVG